MDFNVRMLTADDAVPYYELRANAQEEFPEFVGVNGERELLGGPTGTRDLLARYPKDGTVVWGAFQGNTLVATVAVSQRLSPKYRHKIFLWGMYVRAEYRAARHALRLMMTVIDWAQQRPELRAITLQVTTTNDRARQFYERFGFRIFGTEQESLFARGRFHDVHHMEFVLQRR